jgi:fumarylpyruvate hydrolase
MGHALEDYVLAAPPVTVVPVAGGKNFPVRRVLCVGRNYAAHAREMGGNPTRAPPFFFLKPADALVTKGADTPHPPATGNLHHEIELVVAIGEGGANISAANALRHVFGYAVGIDLTRRDLQDAAKADGGPGT